MISIRTKPLARFFGDAVADRSRAAEACLLAAPRAEVDAAFASFHAESRALEATTLRDRLDRFRDHLGEEHYRVIASGPSLRDLLDEWFVAQKAKVVDDAIARLLAVAAAHPVEGSPPLGRPEAAAYFATEMGHRGNRGDL